MKKNSFVQGAFIATLGIILSKILGILYVIPFYAIIGSKGGALYGYAYNIYSIFLGISSAGIPLAISKIISEYNILGYYNAKDRAFKLGKKTLIYLGVICFTIMFFLAPFFAKMIIGNVVGGNTLEDVTLVIRVISSAILVIPILSVYRGYLQGHKFITPTSISQVLEQLIRVIVIIVGSYVSLKVFKLSLSITVSIAVFSATLGGLVSYLYLLCKSKKNKDLINLRVKDIEEPYISNKTIIRKILIYAFPFIMIDIFKSLYNSVDVMMLVKVLVNNLGFLALDAENVMSVISTWGLKINNIVIAISTGIMISLIPNLTASYVKKDYSDVQKKINQALQIIGYFVIPMTVGLSILAKPVWTIFYGVNDLGVNVYQFYAFVALSTAYFTVSISTVQLLKEYKLVLIALICGFLTNVILNIPLLYVFNYLSLPAYYGSTLATILGYFVCTMISLIFLNRKYKVNYENTLRVIINIIMATTIMALFLTVMKMFIPYYLTNRFMNIFIVILYALVGSFIYLLITYKANIINDVFGNRILNKIKNKIRRVR